MITLWIARVLASLCLLFTPILALSTSSSFALSQKRLLNESFAQSVQRLTKNIPKQFIVRENPLNKKVPIHEMDFALVPAVSSHDELMHLFALIRDKRFLYNPSMPDFSRRITWLYPDDGCFLRAALAGILLEEEHLIRPAKIFIFGDLELSTQYSRKGHVSWWYHVAAVVNYMGSIYVLDPALNNEQPMLLEAWYQRMSLDGNLSGVVCNAYTYDPLDHCYKASAQSDAFIQRDEAAFLDKEWRRIEVLGFDPLAILGDRPPWVSFSN